MPVRGALNVLIRDGCAWHIGRVDEKSPRLVLLHISFASSLSEKLLT